jgi:hypothetical protein
MADGMRKDTMPNGSYSRADARLFRSALLLLILAGLASASSAQDVHSRAGSAGAVFLKLGLGARAAGMGEAFTAVTDDASAVYWNPAALAMTDGAGLLLAHSEHFQDVRFEDAAWMMSFGSRAIGLGARGLYTDGLELRETATDEPIGTFNYYDFLLSFSISQRLGRNASLGLTYKRIYERIYTYDAADWAVDGGLLYETPLKGLRLGITLQNVGPEMSFISESFRLPVTIRGGLAYRLPWHPLGGELLLATDAVKARDNRTQLDLGAEFAYRPFFLLRAGHKAGHDTESLSAGVGFRFARYGLDYAFVPNDLGTIHRISLGVRL